jgi:hypothetical protein
MEFDEKRVEQIKRSHHLFLNTQLSLEEIASEVGLDSVEQLRVLWTVADQNGLLDKLGL